MADSELNITRNLGFYGLEMHDLPLLVALVTRDPILLYGGSGLGKTSLIKMIGRSLALSTHRYMPGCAWEDLIGFPLLDAEKKAVEIYPTPISILAVEFPFFDELSRCDLKRQSQVLDILDTKEVNGRPLPQIRQVWASMNPPTADFIGAQPLDLSLAKRFSLALPFPKYSDMDEESRYRLLSQEPTPYPELKEIIRDLEPCYRKTDSDHSDYIVAVTTRIDKLIEVDKRKLMFLKRILRALESIRAVFGLATPLDKLMGSILPLCFPEHLAGVHTPLDAVSEAHHEYGRLLNGIDAAGTENVADSEEEAHRLLPPCERLLLVTGRRELPLPKRMLVFEDAWEKLDELDKSCLAVALFPFLFRQPGLSTANVRLRVLEQLYKIATAPCRIWSFGGRERAKEAFEIHATINQFSQTSAGRYAVKIAYYLKFDSLRQLLEIRERLDHLLGVAARGLAPAASKDLSSQSLTPDVQPAARPVVLT